MRALQLFVRLFPFLLAFVRDRRQFILFGAPARRTPAHHQRRANRLIVTLAGLGPAFIKLAQVLASRADILTEPYLGALSNLYDRVPELPPGVAEEVIHKEFGKSVHEIFARFDPIPLAAASLGQVHRANYKGREVVVKILRPGVEAIVHQDLRLTTRIVSLLISLFPNQYTRAIAAIVQEFRKRIWDEMDLRKEAKNAEAVRKSLGGDERIVVPQVFLALTRRRVLVLEFVQGTRIDQLRDRLISRELQLHTVVRAIADLYLQMMLVDGVFHADPHPGNLLVDSRGRVVLLDFGMVVEVDPRVRAQLLRTMLSVTRQDIDGVINGLLELGVLNPEADRDAVRVAAQRILALSSNDGVAPCNLGVVVEEILEVFRDLPLMLPPELVYFARAAVLVEGIGLRYDPCFNSVALLGQAVQHRRRQLALALLDHQVKPDLLDWANEAVGVIRIFRDLLGRVEREELHVRRHPRDMIELEEIFGRQVRRGVLAVLAFAMSLHASVAYLLTKQVVILGVGSLLSLGLLVFALVFPPHAGRGPVKIRGAPRAEECTRLRG